MSDRILGSLLLIAAIFLVMVTCTFGARAKHCIPEEAVAAVMDEMGAEKGARRWTFANPRASTVARLLSAQAMRPTPSIATVYALQEPSGPVVIAFAYQGEVCADLFTVSPSLWRRVLQTTEKVT